MRMFAEAVAIYVLLVTRLAEVISPRPDETQRPVPWPSWIWQRFFLFAAFPMAAAACTVSLAEPSPIALVFSLTWLALAAYAGIATSWLRATRQAPLPAKTTAGLIVTGTGLITIMAIAMAIFYMIIIVLTAILMLLVGREVIRAWMGRFR